MAGLVEGPGVEAHWTPANVRKFAKGFLKKIAKNALFQPIFQKEFKNPALNFRAFGRKTIVWGNFEKVLKIFAENSMQN